MERPHREMTTLVEISLDENKKDADILLNCININNLCTNNERTC
jgi:hypothetical protein